MQWTRRLLQGHRAGPQSGSGARARGRRWRRSRGGRERDERGAVPPSSSSSDPKLLRAASPSSLPSMAGGRPLPRAAEQGPRGLAELLEDLAPPLPPPSQRPRLGSGRSGGAPACAPASRGSVVATLVVGRMPEEGMGRERERVGSGGWNCKFVGSESTLDLSWPST